MNFSSYERHSPPAHGYISHITKANFTTGWDKWPSEKTTDRRISLHTFLKKLQVDSHNSASHLLHSENICLLFHEHLLFHLNLLQALILYSNFHHIWQAPPTFPPCWAQTRPSSQWRLCVCVVPCIGVTALLCEG